MENRLNGQDARSSTYDGQRTLVVANNDLVS